MCQQVPYEAGVHDIIQQLGQQSKVLLGVELGGIMPVKKLSSRQRCTAAIALTHVQAHVKTLLLDGLAATRIRVMQATDLPES